MPSMAINNQCVGVSLEKTPLQTISIWIKGYRNEIMIQRTWKRDEIRKWYDTKLFRPDIC